MKVSYDFKSFMLHRSRAILFYGEEWKKGTEGKRVPSGHHGIAVSDPQVRSEASRQAEAQPATTKRLG